MVRGQDTWHLNEQLERGAAEQSFGYGSTDDSIHVMGDWDGDGVSTPGVIRPAGDIDAEGEVALDWYLRNSNTSGPADEVVTFGHARTARSSTRPWSATGMATATTRSGW